MSLLFCLFYKFFINFLYHFSLSNCQFSFFTSFFNSFSFPLFDIIFEISTVAANLDEILSNRFSVSTVENTETIKSTEIQNLEINSEIVIESNITELKQGSTEEDSSSSSKEYSSTRNSKISENEMNILNVNDNNIISNSTSLRTDSESISLPLSLPLPTPSLSSSMSPLQRNVSTNINANANANANETSKINTNINNTTNASKTNVLSSGLVQFEDSIVICGSDSDILLQAMILSTKFPNIAVLQSGK